MMGDLIKAVSLVLVTFLGISVVQEVTTTQHTSST